MADPTPEQLAEAEQVSSLTQRFFYAIAENAGYAGGESPAIVDSDVVVKAAVQTIALVVEQSPALKTSRDIRRMSEEIGKRLEKMVRNARAVTEATGVHPVTTFGGMGPVNLQ